LLYSHCAASQNHDLGGAPIYEAYYSVVLLLTV